MIGRTISHYRILSQLASGGMGVVYRAEDIRLGREVAIKFVSDEAASDEQALQRLRAEARAASALNHSNICTIYDVGEVDGHPFLVMELLKGDSLRDRLANGPLKPHKLIDIGIEIADALQAAHAANIIHRDIKPGNIFLTERGHVKILDFGLAKLTHGQNDPTAEAETLQATAAGVTLGTVAYMSPEQATGEPLDNRTDIFSTGVVLYECATGQHPFPGSTSAVTLTGILMKAPIAPVILNNQLPLQLQEVINKCLEKDRELRYQSAAELGADLKRVRRDISSGQSRALDVHSVREMAAAESARSHTRIVPAPHSPQPPSVPHPSSGAATPVPARLQSMRTWGIAAVVLLALLAAGWFLVQQRQRPAADAAEAVDVSEAALQSRLRLATASLQSGNYRSAAGYAAEILASDPDNADARRIRDEAQTMLNRLEAALDEARRLLAVRDFAGASRAIETARAIDPAAPGLAALSGQLAGDSRRTDTPRVQDQKAGRTTTPPEPSATVRATRESPSDRAARTAAPPATAAAPSTSTTPPPVVPPPVAAPPVTGAPAPTSLPSEPPVIPPAASVELPRAAIPAAEKKSPEALAKEQKEQDEEAIRQVIASYGRAIENKDLALFRSIKPNLSAEEERRLQEGFRSVSSQRVSLTVTSISRQGNDATATVRRRDSIEAGGRQQTAQSQQTITLTRQKDRWVIVGIK